MIFRKRNLLRRGLATLLLFFTVLGAVLCILYVWLGVTLDVAALVRMEPPIFVTQYKIIGISYVDKEEFLDKAQGRSLYFDVWSVGESRAVAAATVPAIWKLRLAGLDVEILSESIEEYLK